MYRLCVAAILFNDEKKVWAGNRYGSTSKTIQAPQGGIEKDEEPCAAILRELEEEIGTQNVKIVYQSQKWYKYRITGESSDIQYIGQTQKWFLIKFLGHDREINILTPQQEFRSWSWYNLADLPKQVVSFKRKVYQKVVEEFTPILDRL